MAGLEAEHQSLVRAPIERGPKGIEFYDGHGSPYDVKAPPSPAPGEKWTFNTRKTSYSILKQLQEMFINKVTSQSEPVKIILDSSYMNETDHKALWGFLASNATEDELIRIIEITLRL
ncbi:hypothetical protein [Candidatus Entotheonella palauensis]|uniref:hypothetical protein n=1 Tax=Candidatus Entotheonella palauensis TaxID=93172 RepID=UPI000B7F9BF9|nr:hypothetical protein [Candidatus Entotheonella palauensis]